MKSVLFNLISLVIFFSSCTKKDQPTETVKIPVVSKYETTRQFSVFSPDKIWVAKLANGDSIKSYVMPPDTVTYIYYKKIK